MAEASGILTQDKKSKPSDSIMGGPGGTLSTAELLRARKVYTDYNTETQVNGGTPMPFEEWVDKVWKSENKS